MTVRTVVLALLVAELCGCVGFGVVVLGDQRGRMLHPAVRVVEGRRELLPDAPWPMPADELLTSWGEPDERESAADGAELWTYDFGLRWNGLVLHVLVLPLPFVVPVGRDQVVFTILGGEVLRADTQNDGFLRAALCGYWNLPGVDEPRRWLCGAVRLQSSEQIGALFLRRGH